jgi:hypothetical protein
METGMCRRGSAWHSAARATAQNPKYLANGSDWSPLFRYLLHPFAIFKQLNHRHVCEGYFGDVRAPIGARIVTGRIIQLITSG